MVQSSSTSSPLAEAPGLERSWVSGSEKDGGAAPPTLV